MKTKHILAMALLATLGLTSCSNEEAIPQGNFPSDGVVRFNVGVNQANSRGAFTTQTLQEFGISLTNANSSKYSYSNVHVQKNTDGEWAPTDTELKMYWQNATTPVEVFAMYPAVNSSIIANHVFNMESNQTLDNLASDVLICKKTVTPNAQDGTGLNADGKLNIDFSHVLSLLSIQITLGNEYYPDGNLNAESNPIHQLALDGPCSTYRINKTKSSNFAEVAPGTESTHTHYLPYLSHFQAADETQPKAIATYQCLLVPQTCAAGFTLSFSVNGIPYEWQSAENFVLAENTHYTLKLKLGADKLTPLGEVTISPWIDNDGGDIKTD